MDNAMVFVGVDVVEVEAVAVMDALSETNVAAACTSCSRVKEWSGGYFAEVVIVVDEGDEAVEEDTVTIRSEFLICATQRS